MNKDAGLTYLIKALDFSEVLFIGQELSKSILAIVTQILVEGKMSDFAKMT